MQFTTVPCTKALSDKVWIRGQCLSFWKPVVYNCRFPKKVTCTFLLLEFNLTLFNLEHDNVNIDQINHCDLKVSSSQAKIDQNFANYFLKTKANNMCSI